MSVSEDPRRIADAHLDAVTGALLHGDNDALVRLFTLPSAFLWSRDLRMFPEPQTLQTELSGLSRFYAANGISSVVRRLQHASFLSPDIVLRTHGTSRVTDSAALVSRYSTFSILERVGEGWGVRVSQFSDPMPQFGTSSGRAGRQVLEGDAEAREIFESGIEAVSRSYLQKDFDLYDRMTTGVFVAQRDNTVEIIDSKTAKRDRFGALSRYLEGFGITDVVRVTRDAAFVGPNVIAGHFRNYLYGDDRLIKPSYPSAAVMVRIDATWQLCAVLNVMDASLSDIRP